MMIKETEIFKKIALLAKKEKTPVYAVGGYVRDLFLNTSHPTSVLPSGRGGSFKDIDFVVESSGLEFARKLDKKLKQIGKLVEFPDFDTARYVFLDKNEKPVFEIEFAGARSETYDKKSRKPKVKPTTLEEDLSRRDFTVNAMAVPVEKLIKLKKSEIKKHVLDPFNGQEDLKNKVLKTPLDPDITFKDDPLRMMRAIRFAGQLEFGINPKTLESIYKNRSRLEIVSEERITEELLKMLAVKQPSVCLNLLFQTHLLDIILPEISALDGVEEIYGKNHKNNLLHTIKVVDNISEKTDNVWLRLAGLLHDIGKPGTKHFDQKIGWTFHQHEHLGKKMVRDLGKRLRLPKNKTEYIAKLVRWHQQPISLMDDGITDSPVRRLVVNLEDDLEDLLILGSSDITTGNPNKLKKRQNNYVKLREKIEEVNEKDKLRAFQSPVRGEEIMKECGLKSGPTVGKIKKDIEDAILDGKVENDYKHAKKYFEKIKAKYLKQVGEWEKI